MYDEFDKNLMEEIWKVHKYMDLSLTEIYNMPVAERRSYTSLHNKINAEEREKLNKR